MAINRRLRSRAGTFVGRLRKMIFGIQTSSQSVFSLLQDKIDYRKEITDLTDSDVVMAPIHWVMRTFPEAPLSMREWKVDSDTGEMKSEPIMEHALLSLIEKPNPFYDLDTLWASTVLSYNIDGNAYWMKVYGNGGMPVQLWWVPHTMMSPLLPGELDGAGSQNDDVFINYYRYSVPGLGEYFIPPEDVVHFRFGQDIDNPRKGLSPLKSALREVYTDQEAADWTATLLKNGAIPGITISPDGSGMQSGGYINENDLRTTKQYMENQFTGRGRGKPHVSSMPIKIEQFGFSPEQMSLRDLRRLPEERISALLGIPAIVAGLGAGLDRSTYSNFHEARESAYESNIIPTQTKFATTIKHQLLEKNFMDKPKRRGRGRGKEREGKKEEKLEVFFDITNVRVLQEDENTKVERLSRGVNSGWMRVSEARREQNLPTNEYDEVYLRPQGIVEVVADEERPDPIDMMMEMQGMSPEGEDDKDKADKTDNNEKDAQQREMEKDKEETEGEKSRDEGKKQIGESELDRFFKFWETVREDDERGHEIVLKMVEVVEAQLAQEKRLWDNEQAKRFMEMDFGTQNPEVKGRDGQADEVSGLAATEERTGNSAGQGANEGEAEGVGGSEAEEGSRRGGHIEAQSTDGDEADDIAPVGSEQRAGEQDEGEDEGEDGEQQPIPVGDDQREDGVGGVTNDESVFESEQEFRRKGHGQTESLQDDDIRSGVFDGAGDSGEVGGTKGLLPHGGDNASAKKRADNENSLEEMGELNESKRDEPGPVEQDDAGRHSGSGTGTGRESGDNDDGSDSGSDGGAVDEDGERPDGDGPTGGSGGSELRPEPSGDGRVDGQTRRNGVPQDGGRNNDEGSRGSIGQVAPRDADRNGQGDVGVSNDGNTDEREWQGVHGEVASREADGEVGIDEREADTGQGDTDAAGVGREALSTDDDSEPATTGTSDAGEVEEDVSETEGAGTGALAPDAGTDDAQHDTGDTDGDRGRGEDNGGADSGDESGDTGAEPAGVPDGEPDSGTDGSAIVHDATQDQSEDTQDGAQATGDEYVRVREGELDDEQLRSSESVDGEEPAPLQTTSTGSSAHDTDNPREGQRESANQDGQADRDVRGSEGDGLSTGHDVGDVDEGHRLQGEQGEPAGPDQRGVLGVGAADDGTAPVQRSGSDTVLLHAGESVSGAESNDADTEEGVTDGENVTGRNTSGIKASDSGGDRDGREGNSDTGDVARDENPSGDDGGEKREIEASTQSESIGAITDDATDRASQNDDVHVGIPRSEHEPGSETDDDSSGGSEDSDRTGEDDDNPGGQPTDDDDGDGGDDDHSGGNGQRADSGDSPDRDQGQSDIQGQALVHGDDGRKNAQLEANGIDGGLDDDNDLDQLTEEGKKKGPFDSGEIMFGLLDALGIQYKQRTREADQLIQNLTTALPALAGVLNRELEEKFAELGTLSGSVFLRNSNLILTSNDDGTLTFAPDKLGDAVEQLRLTDWKRDELGPLLERHTERVALDTVNQIGTVMNIAINIPDPVMRELIAQGGTRMGLIDIEGDTRKAIFRALHEGRSLGEGAPALARRIREEVPAGRFSKAGPKYRSMLISRTETKFSQNESSLRAYEAHEDITHVLAYDAQLGVDRSDPDCVARNGRTFTLAQARVELGKEHPQGTLSMAPVIKPGTRRGGREDAITTDATRTDETPHVDDIARPWKGPPSGIDPRYYTPDQIREAERLYPKRLRTTYKNRPINGKDARRRVADINDPIEPTIGMLSKEIGNVRQQLLSIRERALLRRVSSWKDDPAFKEDIFERIWFEYLDEMLVTKRRYYSIAQQKKYIEETRDDLIFKAIEHGESGRDARWAVRGKYQNTKLPSQSDGFNSPFNLEDGAWELVEPTELDILIVEDGMNMFNRMVKQWPNPDADVEFIAAPVGRAGQVPIGNNRSLVFYNGYQDQFWYEGWENIIHEMGHALSTADREILQEAVDFMYSRTSGERAQSLRKLTGLPYLQDEMVRPDEFFNPYVGMEYKIRKRDYRRLANQEGNKFIYANEFVNSPYNSRDMLTGEEVISMGLEFMVRSPYLFSRVDPEHFDFILERIMYRGDIDSDNASYQVIREATR